MKNNIYRITIITAIMFLLSVLFSCSYIQDSSADQPPGQHASEDETSEDETSEDETSEDETSEDETSEDETSDDETPDDETPDDETPDDETPDDETPDDETPDDETPDDETSDDETPDDEPFQHDPINEIFDDNEEPSYITKTYDDDGIIRNYSLMEPWNYNKEYNAERSYPLLINIIYSGSLIANKTERMQDYPCFCLDTASNSTWVYALIAELVDENRIDTNRIYLSGVSAGGSGSYLFASNLEEQQGLTVAGIVRCIGGENTALSTAIADKTSVWYHVGLSDAYDFGYGNGLLSEDADDVRRISNQAYNYVKGLDANTEAVETVETATISGYERSTTTLILAGVEIFKKSHYADMGHTGSPAYKDPEVVEWLFNQHLSNRD